jgi:hypothetical protein
MFTHDPFQAYQTLAAFGGATPYGVPYAGIHPSAFAMQPLPNPGIAGLGHYPQQGQGYPQQGQGYPQQALGYPQQGQGFPQQGQGYPQQALGYPQQGQGYPQQPGYPQQLQGIAGQQGPWQQFQGWNPLTAGLQNPIQQHQQLGHLGLQNPLLNPMLAYQVWQQQQTPFGYPLAPQSLIGGAGIGQPYGQPYGQVNPLAQFALRQSGLGLSPFAGY